jgi:signal transduction histidine kinase
MKSLKKRFGGLYWHQFFLTTGMVLLTLLLLGASFYALSYSFTISQRREEMRSKAELVARLSVPYLTDGTLAADSDFRDLAGVAASASNIDFLICNTEGNVLLTSDESLVGKTVIIPEAITEKILGGTEYFRGNSDLAGCLTCRQYLVGIPVKDINGTSIGMVLAVMENTGLMELWRSFIALFFVTSVIVLLLAAVASSMTTMRQVQPIREMVQATRAYAAGNFDIRMQDSGRSDEIGELESAFNTMADSLAETERQRRDFIANISHELKTPMTSIAGYTDGILDGTIPPDKERHYLQIISDESRRLSRLVRRMLDISQIQSNEMKKSEFDICESMRLALLSMEQKINDRELDVEADIPDEAVMVEGDNVLITQVIYNLLENAAKYAAAHSTLYLGVMVNGEKALVSVRNQGLTISAEEIPLLFERFHKSDKSRSVDKDGYGLGLYVVKTILDQHKEKITVTSENGLTSFTFTMQMASSALHA